MRLASGLLGLCLTFSVSGCGSEDEFTACSLGENTGAWLESYRELEGNCGPLSSNVVIADAPDPPGCVYAYNSISDDKCEGSSDFTCPTSDGRGTQHVVVTARHIDTGLIKGTATIELDHPDWGYCKSTYQLTVVKQ
jgi:hypothetical protein